MVFHKIPDYFMLIFLSGFVSLISFVGDRNLRNNTNSVSRAVVDNLTHSLIGGFSWIVLLILLKKSLIQNLLSVITCFLISSLIDIDHFISSRSYKLQDATNLTSRPFLHCTTLSLAIFLVLYYISSIFNISFLNTFAWITLISSFTHHIRDGHRRGLWLAPFGSTYPIPQYLYLFLNAILPYIVYFLIISSKSLLSNKPLTVHVV